MSSEPSIITREQIDTLRGLLQDVDTPSAADRHQAVVAIGGLLDRVEARPGTALLAELERLTRIVNGYARRPAMCEPTKTPGQS